MIREHVLLVGDETDFAELRRLVDELPATAYGQIFVELAPGSPIPEFSAPSRITVSWLHRDATLGVLGDVPTRGELAARAAIAWMSEWVVEGFDRGVPFVLWFGGASGGQLEHLSAHLAHRIEHLHPLHG